MRSVSFIVPALALLGVSGSSRAQDVQALVNETMIGTEEVVRYTIEVRGAEFSEIRTPTAPEAEGLAIIQRNPATQTSISITGATVVRSIGFSWRYQPLREGGVRIPSVDVTIGDQTIATEPIDLTVVPQSQRPVARRQPRGSVFDPFNPPVSEPAPSPIGDRDIYIRATPSARKAFQNEQVTIDYELFFRSDLQPRNSRLADSWDAEGFWREELETEPRPVARTEVINGVRYNVILLKRVAVFPTRQGQLTVDPLRIQTEVIAPRRAGAPFSRPFFSLRSPIEVIERASLAVPIESVPVPSSTPETFSGAVGQFRLQASTTRDSVEVGESVQFTVRISGTGNLAVLERPVLSLPGVFEAYDPEVETSVARDGDLVHGTKTFTYLLVPRSNGNFVIPSVEFAYFDPRAEQFHTLRSEPRSIAVTGAADGPSATGTTMPGFPVDDITRLLPSSPWVALSVTPLHRNPWGYVILAFPLVLLGLVVLARRRTTRLAMDTAYARSLRAHPLARKHLKQARIRLRDQRPRQFYEELERAVRGFIGDRLNIQELGLTRAQLDAALEAARLSEDVRRQVQEFLATCDTGRFAPDVPGKETMDHGLEGASRIIVLLDAAFRAP